MSSMFRIQRQGDFTPKLGLYVVSSYWLLISLVSSSLFGALTNPQQKALQIAFCLFQRITK
ncbi:hypothetical protein ASG87_18045 [Frateuria sp. Soil773]|nr:hypothetical protein ASG87_18045 [Frateuria sp. Soil773]